MSKYDPDNHHRRSIRLKEYDYTQEGAYFITICVNEKENLFGEIVNGEMHFNDAGKMIGKWYFKLEEKFPDMKCGPFVIMPNHFHCIIIKHDIHNPVGANPCVRPDNPNINTDSGKHSGLPVQNTNDIQNPVGANPCVRPDTQNDKTVGANMTVNAGKDSGLPLRNNTNSNQNVGLPLRKSSLFDIIHWFKTMTTNEYIRRVKNSAWKPFRKRLWQRNYYEHVIRSEESFRQIAEYIVHNPAQWEIDSLYQPDSSLPPK